MTYQQEAIRRGGVTPKMTGCRRNPLVKPLGWADPRRRAALLVARVPVFEYATLLAPCATRVWAQRGRGDL